MPLFSRLRPILVRDVPPTGRRPLLRDRVLECVRFCAAFESDVAHRVPLSMFPEKPSAKSGNLSGYESGAEAPHSKTLARLPRRFREERLEVYQTVELNSLNRNAFGMTNAHSKRSR